MIHAASAAGERCWQRSQTILKYRVPIFFIEPAQPRLRVSPPVGDGWLHEVKFDGYRIQLHKHESTVSLFSKGGYDFKRKFPPLVVAVAQRPVRFLRHRRHSERLHFNSRDDVRCVWAFDLLYLNGKDLRSLPLVDRKGRLEMLVCQVHDTWLCYAETFTDGATLLKAADRMGLEGIVSKKAGMPYRSGSKCDWIKVKCASWRETNRERWRLFDRH